ncbi:MAG: alkaline phosphatase family protein [Bryobacterales bacterium]|nr:alkaline phosphatase family protein [Bryobacterales bacterium]
MPRSNLSRRGFLAGGLAAAAAGCAGGKLKGDPDGRKVIVLGLDGMEPKIIRALIDSGRAPNFKKLAEMGVFRPLGTTIPALSPVAWSSFITGMSPGGHGIPDFIARDPLTYQPFFSIWEARDIDRTLAVGDYRFAVSGGEVENLRSGRPFWSYLTEKGIPATVIKIPTNFPVEETATRAISGMGTPDVVDSFGVFTYYSSDPEDKEQALSGGEVIRAEVHDGRANLAFHGPGNSLDASAEGPTRVPFTVHRDSTAPVVRIEVGDQLYVVKEGEFSDWIKVRFDLIPHVASVAGITRIMVKQVHPHLKLYAQPINIDPEDQAMPVTYPPELGGEIARHIGPFWTKGLPSDTKAFDLKIFRDEDYVSQADLILDDRMALFDYEWANFSKQKSGLFYFYVSSTDQDAHMLWRNMDDTHPMHAQSDVRYSGYIQHVYERTDEMVGKVLPAVDDKTLLVVCSDHGFAQFGRQFHLNTWLRDQGYLVIKDYEKSKERTGVDDVDWDKTVAYGIGFNGLYLNRVGREERGVVSPEKAPEIIARITKELEAIDDPDTGKRPVHKVYERDQMYSGDRIDEMPEMLVGYTPGYRCANDSILGETVRSIIDINTLAWGGDHSMAPELVPGSVFLSRNIARKDPNIVDLPVTILEFFGIEKPEQMTGRSLFRNSG